jgi:glycosyltransferase involved in cell wall biosynthesis
MRILLSAYACEPDKGSEPGVGWHWAIALARLGHEVTVLTRSNNRETIIPAIKRLEPLSLNFVYFDLPYWMRWSKRAGRGVHLYYQLWQMGVYRVARRLSEAHTFDIVHHLTFTVFRQPSYLGHLGISFVIGPLGGGEFAPPVLAWELPLKARMHECFRWMGNRLALQSPAVRAMLKSAAVILCKTPETLNALPAAFRSKCLMQTDIGVDRAWLANEITLPQSPQLLYAGRLLCMKGVHLAMDALAVALRHRNDIRLTIVGRGPDKKWLVRRSQRLGISEAIRWHDWMPQDRLREEYRNALAFIMPSLHDSSGNVVYESLALGTPVICLKTGGPGEIVPEGGGFRIATGGRLRHNIVEDLAKAILALANGRRLAEQMSENALTYARQNEWNTIVAKAYTAIESTLKPV